MDKEKRLEEYLARAREAEERAAASKDESSHRAWKAIADAYRYLAGSEGLAQSKEARHQAEHTGLWHQASVDVPESPADQSVTRMRRSDADFSSL